jgi:Tol biopolymer transport system component/DNA-binding winged helix-turn-helix (wHTH) protein
MSAGRIALAAEADFNLGPWLVQPSLGQMRWGDRTERLEPRVLQALIVLGRAGGRTVSREVLMRQAWGTVVSEDAVGRCIARLRAVLGQGDGLGIETIPKIGYRLTGLPDLPEAAAEAVPTESLPTESLPTESLPTVETVPEAMPAGAPVSPPPADVAPSPEPIPAPTPAPAPVLRGGSITPWRSLLVGGCVLALLLIAAATLYRPHPATPEGFDRVRPLTADAGREISPALSPTGGMLAYSARAPGETRLSLFLQSVEEGTPVRLTGPAAGTGGSAGAGDRVGDRTGADDIAAAWSPDGARLAFARTDGATPCRLMVVPVPAGTEREVGRCAAASWTGLDWIGADALVYSDRVGPGAPMGLHRLSLSDGTVTVLTDPPGDIAGDFFPRLSPDGRTLAFSRRITPGLEDVHLLDLGTGTTRRLTQDRRKLHGLDWTADGGAVVIASNRLGDFALWSVAVDTGVARPVAAGLTRIGAVATAAGRIAAEVETSRATLMVFRDPSGGDGGMVPLVPPSTGRDWNATIAPDGTIAYVSDRSGRFELWRMAPGDAPRQITDLRGLYPEGPQWSPDGRRLAVSVTAETGADILLVDSDGARPALAAGHPADDRAPAWSADGAMLYFASNRDGGWRIWRSTTPFDTAEPVTRPGWIRVRDAGDGRSLFLVREVGGGLWRMALPDGVPEPVIPDLHPWDVDNWAVDGSGIVFVQRDAARPEESPRLVRLDLSSGARQVLGPVPNGMAKGGLTLTADGAVVLSLQTTQEADIRLVEMAGN